MRAFLLTISISLIFSGIARADYTLKSVYKLENEDTVKDHDGSDIMNATLSGVSEGSNGTRSEIKCLVSIIGGMISGHCQSTDQDGDVEYMTAKRDMSKGNQGTFTRTGGTGKYHNSEATCAYVVELSDFAIGVGYLTANCKE